MITEPTKGNILVELSASEWGDIPVPEKSHDSLTYGKVISVSKSEVEKNDWLVGRTAYWRKYRDDARIGENMCFIEVKDIMGTSYENTASTDK